MDIESDDKGQMGGLKLRDVVTGDESSLKVRGLFYGIGHSPNSQLLEGQIELDDSSYVVVEPGTTNTTVEGVYAAGDIQVCDIFSFSMCLIQGPLSSPSHCYFSCCSLEN